MDLSATRSSLNPYTHSGTHTNTASKRSSVSDKSRKWSSTNGTHHDQQVSVVVGDVNARDALRRRVQVAAHHDQAAEALEVKLDYVGIFADVLAAGDVLDAARHVVQSVQNVEDLRGQWNRWVSTAKCRRRSDTDL